MKILVVNADDFGYSHCVNKGIIKTHTKGIVNSTSVMVNRSAAKEAKNLFDYPKLSVGLHFDITDEGIKADVMKRVVLPLSKVEKIKKDFDQQIKRFFEITGRTPDHLDSHHHVHLLPKIKPIFEEYSQEHKVPVRAFKGFNFINSFFGWDKLRRKSLKRISVNSLLKILAELKNGVNEIMCHPGFIDDELKKSSHYLEEREKEAKTLTDKRIMDYIKKSGIELYSWKEI